MNNFAAICCTRAYLCFCFALIWPGSQKMIWRKTQFFRKTDNLVVLAHFTASKNRFSRENPQDWAELLKMERYLFLFSGKNKLRGKRAKIAKINTSLGYYLTLKTETFVFLSNHENFLHSIFC